MKENEPLVLSVDRDGSYYLSIGDNVESPVEEDTVVERVSAVIRQNPAAAKTIISATLIARVRVTEFVEDGS